MVSCNFWAHASVLRAPLSAHDSLIQNQSVNLTFAYFHTKNAILIEITCTQMID